MTPYTYTSETQVVNPNNPLTWTTSVTWEKLGELDRWLSEQAKNILDKLNNTDWLINQPPSELSNEQIENARRKVERNIPRIPDHLNEHNPKLPPDIILPLPIPTLDGDMSGGFWDWWWEGDDIDDALWRPNA